MNGSLIGKNAIVTGSNRGIGNQIVRLFAREGCNIWACARKQTKEYENELEKIADKNGVWITPLYFDITDYDCMKSVIRAISKSGHTVDALVNCAGTFHAELFQMTGAEQLKSIFETNLFAPIELTRYVLKLMIRQKKGSIVNIGSVSGLDPHPANTAYGSSKAALIMFTKILASEVAELGIRVNAVAPGITETKY